MTWVHTADIGPEEEARLMDDFLSTVHWDVVRFPPGVIPDVPDPDEET